MTSLIRSISPRQAAALAVVVEQEMDPESMSILNTKPKALDADALLTAGVAEVEKRNPNWPAVATAYGVLSLAASARELVKKGR